MEELKVGDKVKILGVSIFGKDLIGEVATVNVPIVDFWYGGQGVGVVFGNSKLVYEFHNVELIIKDNKKLTKESRSKQISKSLKQICTKGLVIKSEDIITKVKESIGTDYVFGDTILRSLRHLRQDGILDYTADKHTREYTFK